MSQKYGKGVDFGFGDRSVTVSQEAYSIFIAREAAGKAKREALQQRLNVADQRVDDLKSELTKARELLKLSRQFVINGVDLGYIQMPEADTPDPANDLVPQIDALLPNQSAPAAKIDCGNCAFVDGVCSTGCETKRIRDEQP